MPNKMDIIFRISRANFRQTRLLPHCRPGVIFCKVKARQPWNLWEELNCPTCLWCFCLPYKMIDFKCGGAVIFWDFDIKKYCLSLLKCKIGQTFDLFLLFPEAAMVLRSDSRIVRQYEKWSQKSTGEDEKHCHRIIKFFT